MTVYGGDLVGKCKCCAADERGVMLREIVNTLEVGVATLDRIIHEYLNSRGLLVYVASYLEATLIDVPDAFSESLFLMLKSACTTDRLLFGNIYRSPSSTQSNDN